MALSIAHLSPLGSQMSFAQPTTTRIENVADWEAIARKYRVMNGGDAEESGSHRESETDNVSTVSETGGGGGGAAAPAANNTAGNA